MTEKRECKNEPAELQELFGDIHPDQELAAFGEPSVEIEILVKCAICLSPKANIDITELKTREKSYKDIFSFCLDLEITEKLETQKLCTDCFSKLLSFDEFKTLALKNYVYFNAVSPECAVSPQKLQDNGRNYEINPLNDGDNDHIGDETNDEIKIKTEHDIKEEDLTECTLDNKAECNDKDYLDEKYLFGDIEAVPEVNLEKLVSEDQLGGELTVASVGDTEESRKHISELDRPTDICRKCGRCVWDITGHLLKHVPKSTKRPRFVCDYCDKDFGAKRDVRRHIETQHMGLPRKRPMCNICNKVVYNLKQHNSVTHREDYSLRCSSCLGWFTSMEKLREHNITPCHKRNKTKMKRTYKCEECPRRFLNEENLRLHKLFRRSKCRPKCDICHKEYSISGIKQHKKIVHEREQQTKYLCQICSKQYFTKAHLKRHLLIHTNERTYKCETCGKGFNTLDSLICHRKIHATERKYQCDICNKKYITKSYLAHHIWVHTLPRTHPCQYCGRMFKLLDQRKQHEANIHEKRGEIALAKCA